MEAAGFERPLYLADLLIASSLVHSITVPTKCIPHRHNNPWGGQTPQINPLSLRRKDNSRLKRIQDATTAYKESHDNFMDNVINDSKSANKL